LKDISKTEHSLTIPLEIDNVTQRELMDIIINIGDQLQEQFEKEQKLIKLK